jgi:uncharacterized protein YjbI with pentapeptide repeats
MIESSISKVAILTLCDESTPQQNSKEPEQYILSDKEATFVGRSSDCQFVLRPKYSRVSRYHAKIELVKIDNDPVWQISDLETPNGTFVNNQKVEDGQSLKSGDCITLGRPSGANLVFEYKSVEVEKLNEAFKKKSRYDETFISDESDSENEDGLTHLFVGDNLKDLPENKHTEDGHNNVKKISKNKIAEIAEFNISPNQGNVTKKLIWTSPKVLIFLATFLVGFFLLYQNKEIFTTQKNDGGELNSYINNISKLLLDKELGSLSIENLAAANARESANAQTLTKLKNLDGQEKGMLLRFLHGAKLIKLQPQKLSEEWLLNSKLNTDKKQFQLSEQEFNHKELVYLRQVKIDNFSPISLPTLLLKEADYNKKNIENSKKCVNSEQPNLQRLGCAWMVPLKVKSYGQVFITPIQLGGSDLTGVVLKDASLEDINLEGAYISFPKCKDRPSGNFFEENFQQKLVSWLSKNNCSANFSGTGFQGARFYKSVLMGANLSKTNLDNADLRQADLRGADLTGASLQNANLAGACYIEENWRGRFPEKGSDGTPFNPVAEKMNPVSTKNSDLNKPLQFQECKSTSTSNDKISDNPLSSN